MMVHSFERSLYRQEKKDASPFWRSVYDVVFPDRISVAINKSDMKAQRQGVDDVVYFADGTSVNVEKKEREHWYRDFLFECWSSMEHEKPGWAVEPYQNCDWFIYAVTNKRFFAFRYEDWWCAWERNRDDWFSRAEREVDGFKFVYAKNHGYTTESIVVPDVNWLKACPHYVTRTFA